MAAKQGVIIKKATNKSNAKYRITYRLNITQTIVNGQVVNKYSYTKVLTPINNKKYSYM